jgi:hypothetical protein
MPPPGVSADAWHLATEQKILLNCREANFRVCLLGAPTGQYRALTVPK